MWSAAEVEEIAGPVHADVIAFDLVVDQLDLVVLPAPAKLVDRLLSRHRLFDERAVFLRDPSHARLDGPEIGLRDRLAEGKVVIEAVFDRRPDPVLGVGIELHHRRSKEVRGRVSKDVERILSRLVIAVSGHEVVSI